MFDNWQEIIRRNLGPDYFHVTMTGPQLFLADWPRYLGECLYRIDLPMSASGKHVLDVLLEYEDYNGIDEVHNGIFVHCYMNN